MHCKMVFLLHAGLILKIMK